MTIEIDAEGNKVEVPEGEKNVEELVEEISTLKKSLNNVVEETKQIRQDRKEAREKVSELETELKTKKEENTDDETKDVELTVEKILAKRDESKAVINKEMAFEKFIADHKMFSAENDSTGLKRDALKKKIEMFNTSSLIEEKDFYSVIKDSANLLGYVDAKPKTSKEEGNYNPYSSSPESNPSPTIVKDADLTSEEAGIINEKGWTKEKFLKLKAKNPEFVQGLL